ncbi:MAG: hypothetical protein KatS3mg088_312 [Patescibacteria group bacterium]|nr:MAG: hypothetical protein KatS3mg088_312 [Patescibacteria group bacterium]
MQNNRKIYLIDLDNCLYKIKDVPGLVNTFETRITAWLANKLGCSINNAEKEKVKLYKKFGGAPRCLVRASIIKNKNELINCVDFIHDFNVSACGIDKNLNLKQKLSELDEELYLFTSSYVKYAKQMLVALGVLDLFSDIIDISKVEYSFKDETITYTKIFSLLSISPNKITMVDDSLENLLVASRMGIKKCVWVNHGETKQRADFVRSITSIMDL